MYYFSLGSSAGLSVGFSQAQGSFLHLSHAFLSSVFAGAGFFPPSFGFAGAGLEQPINPTNIKPTRNNLILHPSCNPNRDGRLLGEDLHAVAFSSIGLT